jgi:hypothetical protein
MRPKKRAAEFARLAKRGIPAALPNDVALRARVFVMMPRAPSDGANAVASIVRVSRYLSTRQIQNLWGVVSGCGRGRSGFRGAANLARGCEVGILGGERESRELVRIRRMLDSEGDGLRWLQVTAKTMR